MEILSLSKESMMHPGFARTALHDLKQIADPKRSAAMEIAAQGKYDG